MCIASSFLSQSFDVFANTQNSFSILQHGNMGNSLCLKKKSCFFPRDRWFGALLRELFRISEQKFLLCFEGIEFHGRKSQFEMSRFKAFNQEMGEKRERPRNFKLFFQNLRKGNSAFLCTTFPISLRSKLGIGKKREKKERNRDSYWLIEKANLFPLSMHI